MCPCVAGRTPGSELSATDVPAAELPGGDALTEGEAGCSLDKGPQEGLEILFSFPVYVFFIFTEPSQCSLKLPCDPAPTDTGGLSGHAGDTEAAAIPGPSPPGFRRDARPLGGSQDPVLLVSLCNKH